RSSSLACVTAGWTRDDRGSPPAAEVLEELELYAASSRFADDRRELGEEPCCLLAPAVRPCADRLQRGPGDPTRATRRVVVAERELVDRLVERRRPRPLMRAPVGERSMKIDVRPESRRPRSLERLREHLPPAGAVDASGSKPPQQRDGVACIER